MEEIKKLYLYGQACNIKECPPGVFEYDGELYLKTDYFMKNKFEIFDIKDGEYIEEDHFRDTVQPCMFQRHIEEREQINTTKERIEEERKQDDIDSNSK